ncbi:MAG: hypothetical protein HQL72_14115 [Magnetococcales bacterium]|nr:hypothetical protein [Magnetococcales bacterium]
MRSLLFWLALTFSPLIGWAGEPPSSQGMPQEAPTFKRIEKLAPRAIMRALPADDVDTLPELTERIRRRMAQTGFILNHPPPNDYIIGSLDKRNLMGRYDQVLIQISPNTPLNTDLIIHRPGPMLIDPITGEKMGILSFYIGALKSQRLTRSGTVAVVEESFRTITAGDRLLRRVAMAEGFNIHHSATTDMEGAILRIENDLEMAGSDQLFIVGLGRRDRATLGLKLPIYQSVETIIDPVTQQRVPLPARPIGHGVLIRIGEKASIAFLTDSTRPIRRGDRMATSP